ncbi:MAG: hypothetical protein J5791_02595 [Fibrobacter sp.]|nr:hypothetical protein [Fibrobacter sp.]
MNLWYRTLFASLVIATLFALLAACDSGGTGEGLDNPYSQKTTLSGFVQKGPFSKGSKISIQELDAVTLLPVGNATEGEVLNDEGTYLMEFVEYESPFALLTAEGKFRDELTEEKTKSPVTLYALVDLTARKSANVNLLTHLEYMRVLYLVKEEGLTVAEAKKQAEREVFAAFAIDGNFELAEDLNIYSDGDGNAALFAISVLMLGGLDKEGAENLPFGLSTKSEDAGKDESKLAQRIADFADDLSSDGIWRDAKTAALMADWAEEQSRTGKFDSFRKSAALYIDYFWWKVYGFDACDSKQEGSAWLNQNSYSVMNGVSFMCRNEKWIPEKLPENEKDTVDVADTTGVKDTTGVADTTQVKDTTSVKDTTQVKDTASVADTSGVTDTTDLSGLSDFEKDTRGLACQYFGKIEHGVVDTNNVYFCYGKEWKLFDGDENAKYYKMIDSRDGRIYRYVYIGSQKWMAENLNYGGKGTYTWNDARSACPDGWHLPSKEEWDYMFKYIGSTSQDELDKFGFAARPAGLLGVSYWTSSYDKDSQGRYPYDIFFSSTGTGMSRLHDSTSRFPVRCVNNYNPSFACTDQTRYETINCNYISYLVCADSGWVTMSIDEYNEFKWTVGYERQVRWDDSSPRKCMVYENSAWHERDSSNCKLGIGGCTAAYQDSILKTSNGAQYICDSFAWRKPTHLEIDTKKWGLDYEEGAVKVADCYWEHTYVFQDGKWRQGTELDSILVARGGTACLNVGEISSIKYDGKYYQCTANASGNILQEWVAMPAIYNDTHDEIAECCATGLYGNGTLHNMYNQDSRIYACDDGEFRRSNRPERFLGRGCTSYNRGEKLKKNLSHFVCGQDGWIIDPDVSVSGTMVDDRNDKEYRTVDIWNLTWMAENLNFADASKLTVLRGRTSCYNDDEEKCEAYGTLYGCAAARAVCPDGWRLPVQADIDSLILFYYNMGLDRSKELRSSTGWTDPDGASANGDNRSGFNILPGGHKNGDGTYEGEGQESWFWYDYDCDTRMMGFYASYDDYVGYSYKDDVEVGYYVRCVKDPE